MTDSEITTIRRDEAFAPGASSRVFTAEKPLRVGVVGTGGIAAAHARAVASHHWGDANEHQLHDGHGCGTKSTHLHRHRRRERLNG